MFIVLIHSWTILYPTVCIKKYGITCVTAWHMNSMVWVGVKECEGHACSCWPPLIEGEIADEELDLPPEPVLPTPVTWNGRCHLQMYMCVSLCMRVLVRSFSMDHLLRMVSFVVGKQLAANTCAEEWNQEIAVTAKGRCCCVELKMFNDSLNQHQHMRNLTCSMLQCFLCWDSLELWTILNLTL